MDQALKVGMMHGASQRFHQHRNSFGMLRQGAQLNKNVAAVDKFPGDERIAVKFAERIELYDVGMVKVRRRLGTSSLPLTVTRIYRFTR